MKLITVAVAALASIVAASPFAHKCKPATYRCERSLRAWDVCNTSGDWVFAGRCPRGTICKFNKQNNSPYCLPRRTVEYDYTDEYYYPDEELEI
ncbi:hypothetical protein X797_002982 [Metarhizium robertsii]|uniref:Uncharacterized protein n=2 Tax=Metarhizium robertsii TaxID=568076 RepID=E9ETC4_METRA|nr:uncharacterized protein MAA_03273 [Metarhizium robertsii ARSEF 23]EFZ00677.1 hypothetical protein MAA_03273 [Metarhizium robertsii ARSEF 23]EXV03185.1 hypothetical protein X797_002982 [Metarhizium robertsii]